MAVSLLESRYLDCCQRREVAPNPSVVSSLQQAQTQEKQGESSTLDIILDHLSDSDFTPLLDVFSATGLSGISAVDVHQGSPGVWSSAHVLPLFQAVGTKLRTIEVRDWLFWKDMLREGLPCQILNLRFSPIVKLNLSGTFLQLHTLYLDYSVSLANFSTSCFSCMPNLMRLSMCETRISNLWTTCAALSKLSSLVELRFQNCLCCDDTRACQMVSCNGVIPHPYENPFGQHHFSFSAGSLSITSGNFRHIDAQSIYDDDALGSALSDDESLTNQESLQSTTEESFDSEVEFPFHLHTMGAFEEGLSDATPAYDVDVLDDGLHLPVSASFMSFNENAYSDMYVNGRNAGDDINALEEEDHHDQNILENIDDEEHSDVSSNLILRKTERAESSHLATRKHVSHHPSPICFEKHYREYVITSLPNLNVLDNMPITNEEREKAKHIIKQHFQIVPYNRSRKRSVISILSNREVGFNFSKKTSKLKRPYTSTGSSVSFCRSISAAKMNSCPWPCLKTLTKFRGTSNQKAKNFRPRQFEYHPSDPSLMVFGTLDGEVVVINPESGKLVGYVPSPGSLNSILGLCWLKKHPSKLIAGSDSGSLKLYNVHEMPSALCNRYSNIDASAFSFDEFEHLTSVHINSTDERFLASGFTRHVALYDIASGRRLQIFKDLHQEHINVVKFAHHSPFLFATASFDQEIKLWDLRQGLSQPCYTATSSRGNVMVCFSPDDHYLLSSAVDNEVRQHLAVDGRLHMKYDIASSGSAHNYTRSYYLNGRDYIISGSSEENVVRLCCAQTGRRLRDISLEVRGRRNTLFVQSLRGDPFRAFHVSVLAAYMRPSSKFEIIRVNMLASSDCMEDDPNSRRLHAHQHLGG